MRPDPKRNRPWRGAAPESSAVAGRHIQSTGKLDTDDLKAAAVVAFRTGNRVRVCDTDRCVDVIPDVEMAELLANGHPYRHTWLQINSSNTFPGRRAYVYSVPAVAA